MVRPGDSSTIQKDARRETILLVLCGLAIGLVVLLTSAWVSMGAREGTSEAVDSVSEFYLDELAGKRARIVETELEADFDHMQDALDVLDEDDLASQDALRAYLGRVTTLIGVERFALVDENGIVYTRNSTSSGLSRYTFLAEGVDERMIRTSNLYGAKKQVVLAMPVEGVEFQGAQIVACFVQVNIDEMISSLVLQDDTENTYVNLYYRNGEDLTNSSMGPFGTEGNFLGELAAADLASGYSYDKVVDDFLKGRAGQVAFTYQGTEGYVCYRPIEGTNWMLAVLVGDNVISEQIGTIGEDMLWRSLLQIAVVVAAMVLLFWLFIRHSRKNARLALQKEVSDNARVREALAQAEYRQQEMESIHGALGSGPWSMDFDEKGKMVSCTWTDTFRSMLGYENAQDFPNVLGSWSDLIHEQDKERVLTAYWDTVRDYTGQTTFDEKYRLLTRYAGYRWVHMSGRLSRREDGSPITFFGMFVDIDDQKRAEFALADALEGAQQANRAKSVFLSNMSHDIRTPMNAIIGFANLAEEHLDDPEHARSDLHKIQASSQHLLSLINSVLDMSKIESDAVTLEMEPMSIHATAENLRTIIQADAQAHGLELVVEETGIVDDVVVCDRLRLNQVLLNLVGNAIKFTDEGGEVRVTFSQPQLRMHGSALYEIRVSDTGIGMSEEFLEKIFVPFERERTSTVSGIQGTGLGMPITKNIVDLMGGTIDVASTVGKGTTFTVTLRLEVADAAAAAAVSQQGEGGVSALDERPTFEGHRALLVEDNALNQEIARAILETARFEVDVADDGDVAVRAVADAAPGHYDVVLMDIQMPRMDGYEATRQIRELPDERRANVPIIAMTANAFEEDRRAATAAGMDAHVAKPIDVDVLLATIKGLLDQ